MEERYIDIATPPIMLNNDAELKFLLSHLKPDMRILEWGSGGSTIELAKHVKEVTAIEHDGSWFNKINEIKPANVRLFHIPRNKEEAAGHDGTYEDYEDYVLAPLKIADKEGRFDVVIVDGRARKFCAMYAANHYVKPDGLILIHDYRNPNELCRRHEYEVVEDFLEIIGFEYAMYAFKVKERGIYE